MLSIHGWFDMAAAVILIGSMLYGVGRRFGRECQLVLGQLVSITMAMVAIRFAWMVSHRFTAIALHQDPTNWPKWMAQVQVAWRHAPSVGTWISFIIGYLILSSVLFKLLHGLSAMMLRVLPSTLARSRLLGGAVGVIAGGVRVTMIGAAVFLCLQYFSIPWLASQTRQSTAYQMLMQRLYQPWLQPLALRAFPVLAKNALEPLSQSISLFAVPTGSPGHAEGFLVIPKPVAALARQLTVGVTDPDGKARILYHWEIHHVRYDWHKFDDYVYRHRWDQQSPLTTLESGKGVCADYALLYADLAHAAGLTVQIDEGIGGTSNEYGSHAWNEVWLPTQHRWITVDTTWGAVQDRWFDVPHAEFAKTHLLQTAIEVRARR